MVASRVGAWIETNPLRLQAIVRKSHPEWVRGLKLDNCMGSGTTAMSHPEWVRGLKQPYRITVKRDIMSHPEWVRGLKPLQEGRWTVP